MKLLFVLCTIALASANHHTHRRSSRGINDIVAGMKDRFPATEWGDFWTKLTAALGESKNEFLQKFEDNQGNMDETLAQFAEKLSANPMVMEKWDHIKQKWAGLRSMASETTIKDIFDWIKEKVHGLAPAEYPSFEKLNEYWTSLKTQSLSFWNQVSASYQTEGGRRHRRQAEYVPEDVTNTLKEIKAKFPAPEWEAFWSKLQINLKEHKASFDQRLQENQGNMDMTLREFGDKLHENEAVKKLWETLQAKWNEASANVDATKVKDVVDWIKTNVGSVFGNISSERAKEWWATASSTLPAYWGRMLGGPAY